MNKLDKAKEIIMKHYNKADCGIFNTRNIIGDTMTNIYADEDLQIDICYRYSYFEVFGLTDTEFFELAEFYYNLRKIMPKEVEE